ncbi:hypothetical protein M440DRAFT_1323853 [Trichoderma longibrachiatum ATCC 18648]|uniref:Folliculin-interacting protein N-terminal domain-containing protein n=1 Tax=Trichoderma longibrachiatum ATCC 18648 TaxID=983965 RepID=A0A2T4CG47_TRILO|nr:hypothetical protein M440DRAFT_1323853 [Trichoderma longibrachiatum ATCC 18648]
MLGRLLHLGSGGQSTGLTPSNNGSRPILSLESVQEDSHTRNLLFPDAQDLYQQRNDQVFPFFTAPAASSASPANAFDYSDEIELDVKDVRVIIMQDALGPTNASLLFDSHPLPESAASSERHSTATATPDAKRTAAFSPRKGSQSQAPRPTVTHTDGSQFRQGAFDRRASVHSRSHSFGETDGQRAAREYREELATFSSCIFGNSELMAYKGTSTKVHVVPAEPRAPDHASSMFGDGRSSIGRAAGRSSKLSQSYSSQTVSPTNPPLPTGASTPRQSDRKKVLITRLFPVTLAADDLDSSVTPPSRYSDDNGGGFPFPPTGDEATLKKKKPQPKQRRTPMYAVVLVVQLPPSPSRISSAVPPKPAFRESGSYNDQELFSSSYSSTRMSGWNMSGSGLYGETTDSSFSIDVEDRIDSLTKHWDIIMRTLTHLQSVVAFRTASQSTRGGAVSSQTGHLNAADQSSHPRRASDAASIRTAGLPIPGHELMSRKSSVATSAVVQDSTTPHFSTIQRADSLRWRRPGSSGSAAADDLKRSLKRGESGGGVNPRPPSQGLRWGSIMSGLWSARRRESIDSGSTYSQASDLRSPIKTGFSQPNKLNDMVRELSLSEEGPEGPERRTGNLRRSSNARELDVAREPVDRGRKSFTQLDRTPDPTGAFESPVKTSINADDGVIDVDVPFPDYIASFESAISSPSSSGYLSTPGLPGLDSFEQTGRIAVDGDQPLNAAGWLNRFHRDFVLQGLSPQEGLIEEVKAALKAEPTPVIAPSSPDDVAERWVDVSTALIADTTTDSIVRITYRRLVKPRPEAEKPVIGGTVTTPSFSAYEAMLGEEWIEETVSVPDDNLAEALDKVIHLMPDSSKEHSSASSQVHVEVLDPLDRAGSAMPDSLSEVTQTPEPPVQMPRIKCKTVVLSALEDTIREVIDQDDGNGFVRKQQGPANESLLRKAVRQWASRLDSGD